MKKILTLIDVRLDYIPSLLKLDVNRLFVPILVVVPPCTCPPTGEACMPAQQLKQDAELSDAAIGGAVAGLAGPIWYL